MASVTFPTEFGGDGNTYTDDTDPQTGLANDGHRTRFVPSLAGAVAMAAYAREMADETHADRQQVASDRTAAQTARSQAQSASVTAVNASNTATAAADAAESSAEQAAINASAIYPSVAQALSETSDGEFFKVPEGTWLQIYRNDDDVAFPVMRLASQDELERLNTRLDPMLTSLLFS